MTEIVFRQKYIKTWVKEGTNSNSSHGEALCNEEVRTGNFGARKIWPERKVSDAGWSINISQ